MLDTDIPQEWPSVRFPHVRVHFTAADDGNASSIITKTAAALAKAGVSFEEIQEYWRAACAGDYDNLIAVTANYVDVIP